MHTTKGKVHTIHHNGDYSGDLHITIMGKEEIAERIEINEFDDNPYYTIKVDSQDIIDLVIEKLKSDKISKIEDMSSNEFIKKYI